MVRCDRCGRETNGVTGSYFNSQTICLAVCALAERAHPQYEEAVRVESAAVRGGNFNFEGIGLPPELQGGGRAE